jgi:hypothetical protein
LFGLHLVNHGKPIGLVESEKTAIVMAGRIPALNWMATGSISNTSLAYDIRGKKVVVFPDANAYERWKEELSPYGFKISDALQKFVTPKDIAEGIDIADVIPGPTQAEPQTPLQRLIHRLDLAPYDEKHTWEPW